jgi:Flp pilus assembly protein protease CpaA
MIEYFVLIITIIFFVIASFEDIKKREVYNYINFSYTFIIIIVAIFHSMIENSFIHIKYVGFGMLMGFALGSMIYYLGIWGGGDAKFLIGFSGASYYLINFANSFSSDLKIYYRT